MKSSAVHSYQQQDIRLLFEQNSHQLGCRTPHSQDNMWLLCRFVILLSDNRDYFFILYLVYCGMNVLLAGIAFLHWPGSEQLELVNDPDGYQVIHTSSPCVRS